MQIVEFLEKTIAGKLNLEEQEEFLESKENISAKELAAAVKFLQKQMPFKPVFDDAIDVCGTGGSGLSRINTSTISAFLLSALGVKVAKHGNKAASGRFGSFDLLEKLGLNIEGSNLVCGNLAFFYARSFYPLMRHFADARKKIQKPTFFNILGPLLSPVNVKRQIIGTAFKDKMQLIAETCVLLGKEKVFIASGEDGLDEVTLTGKTQVLEVSGKKIKRYSIEAKDFGVSPTNFSKIKGGTASMNTKIAQQILSGKCRSRHEDLVLINTALALNLVKGTNLRSAYKEAKKVLRSGAAQPSALLKIVSQKEIPLRPKNLKESNRDFYRALSTGRTSVIAEVKQRSPSNGQIAKGKFDPAKIAKHYEQSGADAISVLCDEKSFGGSLEHLKQASEATQFTPLLCKDFIIHENQIYAARQHGADAILLIAALLTQEQIDQFLKIAESMKMDVLCEVHTEEELRKVLKTKVKIIGINNRDLHTFKIDLKTTDKLAKLIPKGKLIVSESGIYKPSDIPKNVDAILVGSSLMQGQSIQALVGAKFKACGIRTKQDAIFCEKSGVDFIGFNFVPSSKRKTDPALLKSVNKIKKVGVFQNQPLSLIKKIAPQLDFIQLSGDETIDFTKKCPKPVIKTIKLNSKADLKLAEKFLPYVAYILFDGPRPGSAKEANLSLLKDFDHPFMIAGGINPHNVKSFLKYRPLAIDLASGIEENDKLSQNKITKILKALK